MITVITVKELEELKEMSRQLVEQTMSKERRKKYQEGDSGCQSCSEHPPATPSPKIRVSTVCTEAGKEAISSLRKLSSGGCRYPDRRPSEFV